MPDFRQPRHGRKRQAAWLVLDLGNGPRYGGAAATCGMDREPTIARYWDQSGRHDRPGASAQSLMARNSINGDPFYQAFLQPDWIASLSLVSTAAELINTVVRVCGSVFFPCLRLADVTYQGYFENLRSRINILYVPLPRGHFLPALPGQFESVAHRSHSAQHPPIYRHATGSN